MYDKILKPSGSSNIANKFVKAEIRFMGKTWALFLYVKKRKKEYPVSKIFKINSKKEAVILAKSHVPPEKIMFI